MVTSLEVVTSETGSPGAEVTCSGVTSFFEGASVDLVEMLGPEVVTDWPAGSAGGVSASLSAFGNGFLSGEEMVAVVLIDLVCEGLEDERVLMGIDGVGGRVEVVSADASRAIKVALKRGKISADGSNKTISTTRKCCRKATCPHINRYYAKL